MPHITDQQSLLTRLFSERAWTRSFEGVYASNERQLALEELSPKDLGAAIVSRVSPLRAQLKSFQMSLRRQNQAIGVLQLLSSATGKVDTFLSDMESLATASATVSMTDSERVGKNANYVDLASEVYQIAATTEYNDIMLLDGSAGGQTGTLRYQLGIRGSDDDHIVLSLPNFTETGLFGGPTSIATFDKATAALNNVLVGRTSAKTSLAEADAALRQFLSQSGLLTTVVRFMELQADELEFNPLGSEQIDLDLEKIRTNATNALLSHKNIPAIQVLDLLERTIPVTMEPTALPFMPALEERTAPFVNLPDPTP